MPVVIRHTQQRIDRSGASWRALCHENLFPYQCEGADFLAARSKAILADGMGLGKTAQAIRAADLIQAKHILVITTAGMRVQWAREMARWARVSREIVVAMNARQIPLISSPMVVIVSHQGALNANDTLAASGWDVVIVDEAQAYKNPRSKRTQALYGRLLRSGLVSSAQRVWLLSGELAPNHAAELFPHLRRLVPESMPLVETEINFINRFTHWRMSDYGPQILGNKNVDELRAILKPIRLRRKAEDVLKDLPPIMWSDHALDASAAARLVGSTSGAAALAKALAETRDDDERAALLKDEMTHLAVLRREIGELKAEAVAAVLKEELAENPQQNVIVFGWHKAVISRIAQILAEFGVVTYTGETSSAERTKAVDAFQAGGARVFVGQILAAGTGITLTEANQVVFAEVSWSPGDMAQAAKRAHRIGQTRPVLVRTMSLTNSIDEVVNRVISNKARMLTELNQDGDDE